MKLSKWLRLKITANGSYAVQGRMTEEEAVAEIERELFASRQQEAREIVRDFLRKRISTWVKTHRAVHADSDLGGQLDLFPGIPRKLEIAPGRFVDQAWMTRRDWTAAIKQAKTKASNASGYAEAIEQVAEKVLPLLTSDELTTADVWPGARTRTAGGA